MNKAEFVDLVKDVGGFDARKDAEKAVTAFVQAVETALKKNESVVLVGFGTFESVVQKGKKGKVPGSNKVYETKDKYVPKFKAGKNLKESVESIKVK
ncbi:DNA-binding protein [Helicobacter monodelphidis]|uniref:HU family DNA-binding protein n=1 Tax=Helicobacter sp. 15-1451 TaxID=2004995 RepID=UPI000DCB6CBA|nr:HU family DNA-binding protein [Helicobacter sp. 15-1451]RAX58233.1 DNA-binding protein [Helicobacter sp. 15-1451]